MHKIILLKSTLISILFLAPLAGNAQSSCDKLFAEGAKLQQTMTIAAQNKAIAIFEKAKVCYDSNERKNICDQQIKTSYTIIKNLKSAANSTSTNASQNTENEKLKDSLAVEKTSVEKIRNDVKLSLKNNHLTFKAKGGEFKKVKVECNYEDWTVTENPEWVTVSRNSDNELIIETNENDTENERAAVIKVECGDKEVSLIINQKKYNKIEKLKNKIIK